MKKVKSYLKNIQNNEEYQKDIEFLEKKSNGRDVTLLDIWELFNLINEKKATHFK